MGVSVGVVLTAVAVIMIILVMGSMLLWVLDLATYAREGRASSEPRQSGVKPAEGMESFVEQPQRSFLERF